MSDVELLTGCALYSLVIFMPWLAIFAVVQLLTGWPL